MRMPWEWARRWVEERHVVAIENARVAAVDGSRACVERVEVELYVAEGLARRERDRRPRRPRRPSVPA